MGARCRRIPRCGASEATCVRPCTAGSESAGGKSWSGKAHGCSMGRSTYARRSTASGWVASYQLGGSMASQLNKDTLGGRVGVLAHGGSD